MGKPAAKKDDKIMGTDTHMVIMTAPPGSKLVVSLPFQGILNGGLSSNVKIMGEPAATVGSTADNKPKHVPPPGTTFENTPANKGTIKAGSSTVKINGKAAARNGDMAETCNDPSDMPVGKVVAVGTVMIGD